MNRTRQTTAFIGAMALAALTTAEYAATASHSIHLYYTAAVLALAAVTSRMKVKLPGINGNMSVNLPFLLIAATSLSAGEAILITCVATAVQCWPRDKAKFKPQQMVFNLSMMSLASCIASLIFHAEWLNRATWNSTAAGLALASAALFLGQTVPVAVVIGVSEGKASRSVWWNLAHLSFPYYVLSAGICCMVQTASSHVGWPLALAVFPVMYGVHRSYRSYFGKTMETYQPQAITRSAAAGA